MKQLQVPDPLYNYYAQYLRRRQNRFQFSYYLLALLIPVLLSLYPFNFTRLSPVEAITALILQLHQSLSVFSAGDFICNFLMFLPLVFFGFPKGRRFDQSAALQILIICLSTSFVIEFLQIWLASRVTSSFDILAHFSACIFGIAILTVWTQIKDKTKASPIGLRRLDARCTYGCALLLLLLSCCISDQYSGLTKIALLIVGFTLSRLLNAHSAGSVGPAWGYLFLCSLSLLSLYLSGAEIKAVPLIRLSACAAIGFCLQGLLVRIFGSLPRRNREPGLGLTYTIFASLTLVVISLTENIELDPSFILRGINQILDSPLSLLYSQQNSQALATLIICKLLSLLPLGVISAAIAFSVIDKRRRFYTIILLTSTNFLFCISIELLQVFSLSHTPSSFDILVYYSGITLGYQIYKQSVLAQRRLRLSFS